MKTLKYLCITIAVLAMSCDSLFDDIDPTSNVSSSVIFDDIGGAQNALLGAYAALQSVNYYGRGLVAGAEAMADNIRSPLQTSGRLLNQSNNFPKAHIEIWNVGYNAINIVNNIIANIDNVPDGGSDINRIKGEALALRGLLYHDLVKVYGRNPRFLNGFDAGVPLVLEPFTGGDVKPARATVDEVYNQIEADLGQAISIMDNSTLSAGSGTLSQAGAKAILARVHLYRGNWQQAADLANQVINDVSFGLAPGENASGDPIYQNIFAQTSETIFQVSFGPTESLGINAAINIYYVLTPNGQGFGDGVLRQSLIDLFDTDNDLRWQSIVVEDPDRGGERVFYNLKFNGWHGQNVDHIPVIRLAEMYLIRAEANFENGSSVGNSPLEDVNIIRARAGLGNFPGTLTIEDILNERRLELAFEGHRFFDLKRRGLDILKGTPGTTDCNAECVIPNEDFRIVNDIAQAELDVNENLRQNPGYN